MNGSGLALQQANGLKHKQLLIRLTQSMSER
jgi:hypothetical protein